jgi:general secretion pathway protein A
MSEPTKEDKVRLQSYFGFSKIPFTKYMWAKHMFRSHTQSELLQGLNLFLEYKGICMVSGPPGVGKSITLRRLKEDLDENAFEVFYFFNVRSSPLGFFRSLARTLSIHPGFQKADLFDAINIALGRHQEQCGRYPILILDDCDGLSDDLLEDLRLLTNHAMDSEDRFSLILTGTQKFTARIRQAQNKTLKQRINYSFPLKGFTLKEATDYVQFHLNRAEGPNDLFNPAAVKLLFQISQGFPREINQLASHALIQAAVKRKDRIDEKFLRQQVLGNPMFESVDGGK